MPHARPKRHGEMNYFLVGEDVFVETPELKNDFRLDISSGFLKTPADKAVPPFLKSVRADRLFRFGRMFRRPNLPEFRPDPNDLISLGKAMKEEADPGVNKKLPAGYTLLGQFIDHDITFDASERLSYGAVQPEDQPSKRSPSLDLDSLYGLPPLEDVMQTQIGKHVYDTDGINLAFGTTVPDPFVDPEVTDSFPNDLPRGLDPCAPQSLAMIIDPRNDENLPVAQIHLAFIKFHNAVVKWLSKDGTVPPEELLDKAREIVVRHYQWIILYDYLPKIIQADVLSDVVVNGCKHFGFQKGEKPFMPVEFSVAAFRLGHSLVTKSTDWNRYFQSRGGTKPASLLDFFTFTGFAGNDFLAFGTLPSSWVIDWTRFFDFSKLGISPSHSLSCARKICPFIVAGLADLPFFTVVKPHLRSLAVRNLLRGRLLGLPCGQSVAYRLGITPLNPDDIAVGRHRKILRTCGFDRLTPLWYYILRESEFCHQGERLGPVGSRIIAETFVRLIKCSKISILPKNSNGPPSWRPKPPFTASGEFSMSHLLFFVHKMFEGENFLNPLGD